MDLSDFDSQFSDNLIVDIYEKMKEFFPKIENFLKDHKIKIYDGKFELGVYRIPKEKNFENYLECYPGIIPLF